MHLRSLLKHVGLKDKEADVYLTSLQLGIQPASVIAEKANLNRVTAYITLKKLVQKGLAQTCLRNGMQYFTVDNPKRLLDYAARREHEWKRLQTKLEVAIKDLHIPNMKDYTPIQVRSFQGIDGVKAIIEDVLRSDELMMISRLPKKSELYHSCIFEYFFEKIKAYSIPSTLIFKESSYAKHIQEVVECETSTVHLCHSFPFDIDIFIYEQQYVSFIAYENNILSGATVHCQLLAKNLEVFFRSVFCNSEQRTNAQSSK